MKYRRLHIAVSVFFALVAVAFAVLWVRSYSYVDEVYWAVSNKTVVLIQTAPAQISARGLSAPPYFASPGWGTTRIPTASRSVTGAVYGFSDRGVPLWSLMTAAAAFALLPWIDRQSNRFSLRAMLIATTLIAVVLALAVWSSR